jgi:hypothetical protein
MRSKYIDQKMKRPKSIKDRNVEEYVEYLEERLSRYKSGNTIAKFYLGIKKQLDDAGDTFLNSTVVDEGGNITPFKLLDTTALTDKDDKVFERFFKFIKESKAITENLLWLENQITPESLKEVKEEISGELEEVIFGKDGKA